ncbi:hypothetical protein ACTJK6_08660 [Ralstonia sp. 22086]|uniref:hypothetical protein n=1 Tax=Ralstonia sp. 22086 TaxID=3453870 RepID=UPI003F8686C6
MLGLSVLPDPRDDEDLLGFLCRTAQLNALTSAELLKAFRCAPMEDVDSWTKGGGRPAAWGDQSAELRNPGTRPARAWNYRSRKFCPSCLGDAPYWRASWSLMLVTCCTRHSSWLQDCCGTCGASLYIDAMGHFHCTNCGAPLAGVNPESEDVSKGALWVSRQLALRISRQRANTNHVTAHLTLPDFHEVALRIGIRSDTADRKKPLRLRDAGTLAVAKPIADGAGNALMAWPNGFYCLLDTIREQRAYAIDWRIRNAMGPIYQDIYRHLDDSRFDFIRHAFEGYVHDRWEAPLARRNRNLGPQIVREHRWVPVLDAARKIGVDPSLLRRMGVHHEIPTRELVTDSGRLARVINLSAAMDSADRLRCAMTLEQAANQLGISDKRVRQLLTAGLLVALGGSPRAGERWWIDPASIEQCSRCGRPVVTKSGHSVSVAHVAKYQLSDAKQFIAMILAIQSGQLSVWVPPQASQQIGNWLLNEEEIASWRSFEQKKMPIRLSINDAALQLGVKQEVAYALVRSGILPAVVERIGRRTAQWVNASALNQFRKRYVLGNELARLSRTSPKQIAQRLRISGILPVAGPTSASAPCRQYIWPRTRTILRLATAKKPHAGDKR